MKKTKKVILGAIISLVLIGIGFVCVLAFGKGTKQSTFENLFVKGFEGITTNEKELKDVDYVSSQHIEVKDGETIWYGPCDPAQNIQMATFDANGEPVASEKRSKPLQPSDTFGNNLVIYQYEVPKGVSKLCFTTKTALADVYTIAKTEITCLNWVAYWKLRDVDTTQYVGENEFYEVKKGDKIYFGAITKKGASTIGIYDETASKIEKISKSDLKLVESFSDRYGIYCYTVTDEKVKYIQTPTEGAFEQYLASVQVKKSDKTTAEEAVDKIITSFGLQKPLSSTVEVLRDKRALFLGDSITFGAHDKESIYDCGGWAGRIGYFCEMDVENNGVSGACVTTARIDSHSKEHYIYNNLLATKGEEYDYVILHGLYNDANEKVEVGAPQGKANFDPNKADVKKYADALELLFYKAIELHPEAALGYIVNFQTEKMVNQTPYADVAIAICEDWGIPYLDLHNDESFTVAFDDGLHPTSAGYDSMYVRVASWMASLNGEGESKDAVTTKARVMSYNVFWSATDEVPNKGITIKDRVQKVQNTILTCNPDILVLQEVSTGKDSWIPILREFVKENGYGFYGFGHYKDRGIDTTEGIDTSTVTGSDVEMTPILWKTDKYEYVEKGHYWASSTPEKAGSLWEGVTSSHSSGKLYPRCVNWLVLKDKETQEHIMIVSYHADPYTEKVRKLSAQLVMEKISEVSGKYHNLAVVMAGDWNMERDQPTYSVITGNGYADSQKVAEKTTPQATFSAWKRSPGAFAEADYIFVNHNIYVSEFQVYNDMDPDQMGIFVSDHCPIIAEIEF